MSRTGRLVHLIALMVVVFSTAAIGAARLGNPAEATAQEWFIAGTIVLMVGGGGLHALATLHDTVVRPTYFVPIDGTVKAAMEGTGIRLRRMYPGGDATRSIWSYWLGINIGQGLGVFSFGLLCLLIATHDFELIERIDAIRPLTIALSAGYLVLSLRFWSYAQALMAGSATACFTIAAVLSA